MFSNFNTPNQNQGFNTNQNNKPSPFSFSATKTPANQTFQLNSNSFNNQPTTPLFNNQKPAVFNTSTSNNLFGQKPFGSSTSTNLFGTNFSAQSQSNAIPLGPPSSFGSSFAQTSQFGQSNQPSNLFGTKTSTFGGFGSSNTFNTNTFGSNFSQPSSNALVPSSNFGSSFNTFSQPSSVFGSSGGFGSTSGGFGGTSSAFGGTSSAFGGTSTGFGTSSGFGGTSTGFGTSGGFGGSSGFNQTSFGGSLSTFGASGASNLNQFGSSSAPTQFSQPSVFGTSNTFGTNLGVSQGSNFGSLTGTFSQPSSQGFGFGSSSFTNTFNAGSGASLGLNSGFNQNPVSSTPSFGLASGSLSNPISFGSSSFGSSQPFGQSTFNTSQAPFGSTFGATGSSLGTFPQNQGFGAQTSNVALPFSSFSQPSSFGLSTSTNVQSISLSINQESDKNYDVFGYKGHIARFGPPEYYNSTYNNVPDQSRCSDTAVDLVSKLLPYEHESCMNPFEHDIKLGNTINANNDLELRDGPMDTITFLRYNRNSDLLATASWDSSVSVYRIDDNLNHSMGARCNVMGCVFDGDWIPGSNNMILGSSSGVVYFYDVMANSLNEGVRHNAPVKAVRTCETSVNMIVTAGYDAVKVWDIRSKSMVSCVNGKILDLDTCNVGFAFINSDREVVVHRFNDLNRNVFKKKIENSPFPLRCISMTTFNCKKEGGWVCAVGTSGGKISVFAQSNNAREFTFKAFRGNHPTKMNCQIAFPVHHVEFHPRSYALAVGGGDGSVSFWDIQKHSHIKNLNTSSLPVTALDFNSTGRFMAYSVGYDWSRGIKGFKYKTMKPAIYIRRCNEEFNYSPPIPQTN